jgi:hypothetical protein
VTQVTPASPPNNVYFWRCGHCGMAIFTTGPGPGTPPTCVDGTLMAQETAYVPVSLMAVVWRPPKAS